LGEDAEEDGEREERKQGSDAEGGGHFQRTTNTQS
jgi:hypothetical protein